MVLFKVEGIGVRDILFHRDSLPLENFGDADFAVIAEKGDLPFGAGYIHLIDPVVFSLKNFVSHFSSEHSHAMSTLLLAYEDGKPKTPLPNHMLVHRSEVAEAISLSEESVLHEIVRSEEFPSFEALFKEREYLERLLLVSKSTASDFREHLFTTWRNVDNYPKDTPLRFGRVWKGSEFSVAPTDQWLAQRKGSEFMLLDELCREFSAQTVEELEEMAKNNPDIARRMAGAYANEYEILREYDRDFTVAPRKGSAFDLFGQPDYGHYHLAVTHSHPMTSAERVTPSFADINASIDLRERYLNRSPCSDTIYQMFLTTPLEVIIEPTNDRGNAFRGVIFKEVGGSERRTALAISESQFIEDMAVAGDVQKQLEGLCFASAEFSFSRGKLSPSPQRLIENLAESNARVVNTQSGGTPEEVAAEAMARLKILRDYEMKKLLKYLHE